MQEVSQYADSNEKAHALWVCRRRRRGKTTIACPPYHLLPVLVSTILGERTKIEASAIELGPPCAPKVRHSQNVTEETRRLLPVHPLELALVARNGNTWRVTECSPELWKLPDACGLAL